MKSTAAQRICTHSLHVPLGASDLQKFLCGFSPQIYNYTIGNCFTQYQLRLKTVAHEFLHGKKPNLQLGKKWIGDELGSRKINPRASEFINAVG